MDGTHQEREPGTHPDTYTYTNPMRRTVTTYPPGFSQTTTQVVFPSREPTRTGLVRSGNQDPGTTSGLNSTFFNTTTGTSSPDGTPLYGDSRLSKGWVSNVPSSRLSVLGVLLKTVVGLPQTFTQKGSISKTYFYEGRSGPKVGRLGLLSWVNFVRSQGWESLRLYYSNSTNLDDTNTVKRCIVIF